MSCVEGHGARTLGAWAASSVEASGPPTQEGPTGTVFDGYRPLRTAGNLLEHEPLNDVQRIPYRSRYNRCKFRKMPQREEVSALGHLTLAWLDPGRHRIGIDRTSRRGRRFR